MKTVTLNTAFALALLTCLLSQVSMPTGFARPRPSQNSSSATISLQERVVMASQIYHLISTFFPGLSQERFDADYKRYVATILTSDNRRDFDLASMELVADLHDGHSWFYDTWLDHDYGQLIGLLAYPLNGKWTVVRSQLESIQVGDVLASIDDVSIDDFYTRNRRYV